MSSTIDANVLLYASNVTSGLYDPAREFVERWSGGPDLVYVFWPTVMAYLRIATHPRVFDSALEPEVAEANVTALLALPHVRTGAEAEGFWRTWRETVSGILVRGDLVPDAHLVALMRQHGVTQIWTRDRDLRKFDGIRARDPFTVSGV